MVRYYHRNVQSKVKRNPGFHWFCYVSLCDWSTKLAPPSQPIRYKSKTYLFLVTRFSRAYSQLHNYVF